MRISRNGRYAISFAYISEDGNRFGTIPEKTASLHEIDFLFKSVSVTKCNEWISTVKSLRRGGSARIVMGCSEDSGNILKGWIVKKL